MLTRNPLELFLWGGVQVDKLFGKIDLMDLDKAMIELASKKTSFVAMAQHYRSAPGPECRFHRSLRHRPPSNVFGRCVDDSCHAAGLGLDLGLLCAVLLCGVIAARLLDEELYLSKNLPGYE